LAALVGQEAVATGFTGTLDGVLGGGTPAAATVTTLTASGVTTVQAGTALLPSIVPTGDTNTGVWFPAADTVAASTAGTERMRIDSSGNVGIGTTSPSSYGKFVVSGGTTSIDPQLTIESTAFNASQGCSLNFARAGFTQNIQARISTQDNGVAASNLLFSTKVDGTAGALTERMRIDSSGNVGIGTTAPATKLEITHDGGSAFGTALQLKTLSGTDGPRAAFEYYNGGSPKRWNVGIRNSATAFGVFEDGYSGGFGTERLTVLAGGDVGIGTSAPAYKLDINGITGWGANQTAPIANIVGANAPTNGGGNLRVLSNTSATADAGGSLVLGGYYTAQTNSIDFSEISGRKQTGLTTGGYLAFSTRADLGIKQNACASTPQATCWWGLHLQHLEILQVVAELN
jgi:hypothetical protein